MADALIVSGLSGPPTVEFNGAPLKQLPASVRLNGKTAYVIPLSEQAVDVNGMADRYQKAQQTLDATPPPTAP